MFLNRALSIGEVTSELALTTRPQGKAGEAEPENEPENDAAEADSDPPSEKKRRQMSKPLIQLRNARVCKSPRMSMLRTAQSSVISVRRVRPSARVWFLNGDASVLNWGHWVLNCVRPVSADLIKNLCLNFGTWRYKLAQ